MWGCTQCEAQRKVCAAPQLVPWAWDASQGVASLAGEWAGLASALGACLGWGYGARGLRRQPEVGKSCFSHANLVNILAPDIGHVLLRDLKSSEKKSCPLGSPQWFCCCNVISFDSILSSHLEKLGAENQHQRRGTSCHH